MAWNPKFSIGNWHVSRRSRVLICNINTPLLRNNTHQRIHTPIKVKLFREYPTMKISKQNILLWFSNRYYCLKGNHEVRVEKWWRLGFGVIKMATFKIWEEIDWKFIQQFFLPKRKLTLCDAIKSCGIKN